MNDKEIIVMQSEIIERQQKIIRTHNERLIENADADEIAVIGFSGGDDDD
ncbi:hypothetical protein G6R29_01770 [Fructobacillus sp. M2-14]|uniref:Uncharacterized protein n=1 Tax=Fructobacillus broussonetiae TaxID=2713173 RepID=A0ABS5QYU4_9LACO|nr:hypothetical protein [Fructobacillus broussonetiae]MBS9338363.1 hypothetical protein [Fructobacillus broussonetiae]